MTNIVRMNRWNLSDGIIQAIYIRDKKVMAAF